MNNSCSPLLLLIHDTVVHALVKDAHKNNLHDPYSFKCDRHPCFVFVVLRHYDWSCQNYIFGASTSGRISVTDFLSLSENLCK
jgi:hypothetical protein